MLTEKRIRDARPGAKTSFLWDAEVKGLGVRVTPAGSKSYVLFYRVAGRKRLVTLARCSEASLKVMRARAGEELLRIRAGESDPLERRREASEAPTVEEGLDRFFEERVPELIGIGKMKPKTAHEYRLQSKTIREAIGRRRVEEVTRRDIERMVKPLRPVMRNRVLALTSRLFTLFESWEWCSSTPVRFVDKAKEEPRDRTLTESEIVDLAVALEAESEASPAAVAAIRMATMTGLRIGEVMAMKWADVDFEGGRVTLPTTKTGRRVHPLSSAALEALAAIPRIAGVGHVFTTGRGGITYKTVHGAFRRAAARAGLEDVRLHDLRRTLMTRAAAEGIGTHALRDLLGHKTTTMADRYIRHQGTAVREATERMGARMKAIMEDTPKAAVVSMQKRT